MKEGWSWQRAGHLLMAAWALTWGGSAQAQFTNTLNGRQFDNMWAAQADFTLSQMIQRAGWNAMNASLQQKIDRAQAGSGAPAVPAKPSQQAAFKYPITKTDFKFQGRPTQQANCAALTQKAADQQQLAALCLEIFGQIQAMPDFRKHNLAAGLTVLLGVSLQVVSGVEIGDEDTETLMRGLNDALSDTPGFQKMPALERQHLYETAVMTGGLIAGIAQAGEEDGDETLSALAKEMARAVLSSFGLEAE